MIAGRYRVERTLGRGGMGVVVAATRVDIGQAVAIRFIPREALHDADAIGRFLHAARAAAKLTSPRTARVLDAGILDTGSPFIVTELLDGEDLASIVQRWGPVPFATAAAWMLEACEAVGEAHALGIVHGDLRPANLFLWRGAQGLQSIKVFDFGLSRVVPASGFEAYAAPEQLRASRNVDHRTDIWALGVTLYHLVSGELPWKAETVPDLAIQIAVFRAPPLRRELGVPAAFEQVIDRCLEKDPASRYATVAALAEALAPFALNGRAAVELVRRASQVAEAPSAERVAPRPSRLGGTRPYAILVSLLLSLAVFVVAIALSNGHDDRPRPEPTTSVTPPPVARPAEAPVVTAQPSQAVTPVESTPDAPTAAPVASATPSPPVTTTGPRRTDHPPGAERYRELVDAARRLSKTSCAGAIRLYEEASDANPRGHEALAGLGSCYLELKDDDRAINHFRAALAIAPSYPEALVGAAQAYRHKGDDATAIRYYRRYLEVAPTGDRSALARRALGELEAGTPATQPSDDALFGTDASKAK